MKWLFKVFQATKLESKGLSAFFDKERDQRIKDAGMHLYA